MQKPDTGTIIVEINQTVVLNTASGADDAVRMLQSRNKTNQYKSQLLAAGAGGSFAYPGCEFHKRTVYIEKEYGMELQGLDSKRTAKVEGVAKVKQHHQCKLTILHATSNVIRDLNQCSIVRPLRECVSDRSYQFLK
ncbi:hypothetical protein evm_007225 [Chilo suppressalis]|nr:hypothetical protein evm_007225 [Chilo suppressalis]